MQEPARPTELFKKWKIASDLFDFVMRVKSHQLRKIHPELDDREIRRRVVELIERANQ